MSERTKACGTCHYWRGEEAGGVKMCHWPQPDLPFWASIDEGQDHDNWTRASDGKRCKTWHEIEP